MAMPRAERTVLPPEDLGRLSGVLAALTTRRAHRAALIGPDGERLDVPPEVFEILREVVEALAQGLAITIAPHQMILSTSEAADILGVSRPTLVRLLEAGEIPFEQPGRHRRVRLADVLAYHQRSRRHRAAGLDQMVADAEDAGLYELPADVPFERLPVEAAENRAAAWTRYCSTHAFSSSRICATRCCRSPRKAFTGRCGPITSSRNFGAICLRPERSRRLSSTGWARWRPTSPTRG